MTGLQVGLVGGSGSHWQGFAQQLEKFASDLGYNRPVPFSCQSGLMVKLSDLLTKPRESLRLPTEPETLQL